MANSAWGELSWSAGTFGGLNDVTVQVTAPGTPTTWGSNSWGQFGWGANVGLSTFEGSTSVDIITVANVTGEQLTTTLNSVTAIIAVNVSLTGENLCKLIDFMVENEKDDDIRWLQHKILVKCNVFILIYLDLLVQTERFPALAQEVVIEIIDDNMELASMFALIGSNK